MIVDVALPIPVAKTFSYAVPDRWKPFIKRFLRLRVPFHNTVHTGIITDIRDGDSSDLKQISEVIDFFPIINNTLIELCTWASRYYVTPTGAVLKYLLPPKLNIEPYITIQSEAGETLPLHGLSLKRAVHLFGRESVFRYREENLISLRDIFTGAVFSPIAQYNPEKQKSAENILFVGDVQNRLDYYTEIIATAIQKKSNVLMLLPDHFAAGNYFKKVFSAKFDERVFWYGSETSVKSRMEAFFRAREEGGFLILGNKSCVFLPMHKQAFIIVERQEEDEYRNEEGFKFNAVSLAVKRASMTGIPVVLGSACPSMEIYHYAEKNQFTIIKKKWLLDRSSQEKITAPDIRSSASFLEELIPLIKDGVQTGEKTAVFVPRKDYGSNLVCHSCKKPFLCPRCEGILSFEKEARRLVCSICGSVFPYKEQCTECGSNIIRFSRTGVEYVEEKLKENFPDINIIKITGESLKHEMKKLKKIPADLPVVFIGTQSLSKLYDFHTQKLVLLGWEELRKMGGYRSDEKMIQILANLTDALTPEKIVLFMEKRNKINMEHYLECSQYFHEELQKRENADFPPFQRVFLVEIVNKNRDKGENILAKVRAVFEREGIEKAVSGTLMEKKAFYKWKIILKGTEGLLFEPFSLIYGLPGVRIEPDPFYF